MRQVADQLRPALPGRYALIKRLKTDVWAMRSEHPQAPGTIAPAGILSEAFQSTITSSPSPHLVEFGWSIHRST